MPPGDGDPGCERVPLSGPWLAADYDLAGCCSLASSGAGELGRGAAPRSNAEADCSECHDAAGDHGLQRHVVVGLTSVRIHLLAELQEVEDEEGERDNEEHRKHERDDRHRTQHPTLLQEVCNNSGKAES